MNKLLKVDFYRLRKDKTILLGAIIAAGLLLMSLGMFALFYWLTKDMEGGMTPLFTPKTLFIQSFQMGNNVGLVVIIILAVFTSRDFTQNTLRLKVINGFKRHKVYLSMLITNLVYGISLIVGYGLISLVVSSLLFGFGEAFTGKVLLQLLATSGMALLYVILFVSVVTAISMKFQTIGASIGLSIAIVLGESILSMIISSFPATIPGWPEWATYGLNVLPTFSMTALITYTYRWQNAVVLIISAVVLIVLTNALGMRSFKKGDIK